MKKKDAVVTSFSYPPHCKRCGRRVTCKVLRSGMMVCYREKGNNKLRKVM